MLFPSFVFLIGLLPASLLTYHLCRVRGWHLAAKLLMVAASLLFYGWAEPRYVPLVLGSVAGNYAFGWAIARTGQLGRDVRPRRALFVLGISANLGLLGWYKYAGFFAAQLGAVVGTELAFRTVVLPLAISFFTFQQIAYLVETYRGAPPARSALDYALFILFFPHLVAGPITHHTEMLPQFARAGRGAMPPQYAAMGIALFVLGMAKKVLLADTLAQHADPVFAAAAAASGAGAAAAAAPPGFGAADAWAGALAYTFQLYFDFSGYSDMAIGLGLLFGIRFPVNFASPYKSTSIIEFWRRWHITLSRFLRNYLYIPLGGNRQGMARRHLNLLATMVLGGLWHGAGWTFLAWGALHGAYLIANHAWRALAVRLGLPSLGRAGRAVGWGLTGLAVVVGWVFFRAPTLDSAVSILRAMLLLPGYAPIAAVGDAGPIPFGPAVTWTLILFAGAVAVGMPNALELVGYPRRLPGPAQPEELPRDIRPSVRFLPGRAYAPALASVGLGLLAALCLTRLPNPGVFLYFNF